MNEIQAAYITLLKAAVTNKLYQKTDDSPFSSRELETASRALEEVRQRFGPLLQRHDFPQALELHTALEKFTPELMADWFRRNTWESHTLLDDAPVRNVEHCVRQIVRHDVPGDFIECGVFRGGTAIFMRGLLKAYGDKKRKVWVADSFQGLPAPDPELSPVDALSHELLKVIGAFRVSQEAVEENFQRYDLLDEQVKFLPGWFCDSLATAPIDNLALIRLDGDYYESTMPALESLYPKLSPGGFIILDDYGIMNLGARRAVDEYRQTHAIEETLLAVDHAVYYWRKKP